MKKGVIFDLDGVITDTAEYHYRGWKRLADEMGVPFDRERNEALRGLSRMESLRAMLRETVEDYSQEELEQLADRKNSYYVESIQSITRDDLLPGARKLLDDLRRHGLRIALASSSKNARTVLGKLQIEDEFDAIVDGYDFTRSKPDPEIFQIAARRLELAPSDCVVVEDAASGIAAAKAADMKAVGLGRQDMLSEADMVVGSLTQLTAEELLND